MTYRGTYQFTGSPQTNNPSIAGGSIISYWSQVEPVEGMYDWSAFDDQLAQWSHAGKKAILRLSTSGNSWGGYSAHGTPDWIYDLGVQSITENDGSILPQYWHPVFLSKLQSLVNAFAARYDGNPDVAFIQMGIGCGGETLIDQVQPNSQRLSVWYANNNAIGYSDSVWWNTIQTIAYYYQSAFTHTPLAMLIDSTFIGNADGTSNPGYDPPHKTNPYCKEHGIWIQNDGLTSTQTLSSSWLTATSGVPLVAEQLNAATKNGRSLLADLQNAINTLHAQYCLVYGSDIVDPQNQAALQWAWSHQPTF